MRLVVTRSSLRLFSLSYGGISFLFSLREKIKTNEIEVNLSDATLHVVVEIKQVGLR